MRELLAPESIADWSAKKPAGQKYDFESTRGCALCRYLTDSGVVFFNVGGDNWMSPDGKHHPIPLSVQWALCRAPYTYGALTHRLRRAAGVQCL